LVEIGIESELIDVEGLGTVDIGHGHRNEFKLHVHL